MSRLFQALATASKGNRAWQETLLLPKLGERRRRRRGWLLAFVVTAVVAGSVIGVAVWINSDDDPSSNLADTPPQSQTATSHKTPPMVVVIAAPVPVPPEVQTPPKVRTSAPEAPESIPVKLSPAVVAAATKSRPVQTAIPVRTARNVKAADEVEDQDEPIDLPAILGAPSHPSARTKPTQGRGNLVSKEAAGSSDLDVKVETHAVAAVTRGRLNEAYEAVRQGDPVAGLRLYEDVLASDPGNVPALFGQATALQRLGRLEKARDAYERVLARAPNNREALTNLVAVTSSQSPQTAINKLKWLAAANPDFSPVSALLGTLYAKMGDLPSGIQYMQKAVTMSPDNTTYLANLAVALDQAGRYAEARYYYAQTMQGVLARNERLSPPLEAIQARLDYLNSK
ncbi:MAG: tetratricopeptide repeat protein [Alphaproteobacteria bacterium]|nr:tetratricopeptide repeat protein [Alphaproteobacteria bacterium]